MNARQGRRRPATTRARGGMILQRLIGGRIGYSGGLEARPAQPAGVATAAGPTSAVGLVARDRERVVHAEAGAFANDLTFGPGNQGCVDPARRTLHSSLRGLAGQVLERSDEFRSAVWVAGIVGQKAIRHEVLRRLDREIVHVMVCYR